ncbi:MAG: PPOX class F420-dependent oxidoreductase [Candidatus Promineifilaceae bacterium]
MPTELPQSHLDLLDGAVVISLATLMLDGQPQVTPVWCDRHGNEIWINSTLGRQKARNMQERPQVTILAVDPAHSLRWIEVRGQVVGTDDSETAVQHIEDLSQLYDGKPFRKLGPAEKRCIFKIRPTHVNTAD